MREAACRLIYLHITLAVQSISDERTFIVLFTVNTVPHTLRLLTVELICSQVLLTCICSELSVDCLGEETSFIRRLRHCYSITNKDITNTVMQLGRCRMYLQFLPIAWTLLAKVRLIVSKLYTQDWEINHSHLCRIETLLSKPNNPLSKCHSDDKMIHTCII